MKTKIKVTYPGPVNQKVDDGIKIRMERIGADWYAQGTNLETGIRDICFDLEVGE